MLRAACNRNQQVSVLIYASDAITTEEAWVTDARPTQSVMGDRDGACDVHQHSLSQYFSSMLALMAGGTVDEWWYVVVARWPTSYASKFAKYVFDYGSQPIGCTAGQLPDELTQWYLRNGAAITRRLRQMRIGLDIYAGLFPKQTHATCPSP